MVRVRGSTIPEESVPSKCEKYLKVVKKKKIDLDQIGNQHNNGLVDLLRCQCKTQKVCEAQQKNYSDCHDSVMGVGSYGGKRNCGEELGILFRCVFDKPPTKKSP
jgi:hypothetical protein